MSYSETVEVLAPAALGQEIGDLEAAVTILTGYVAYFGRWTIDEGTQTVTHHPTESINPDFDAPFVRMYEFGPGVNRPGFPGDSIS